jgi:hypothetical protein
MRRWTAPSDLDYDDAVQGLTHGPTKACTRCGDLVPLGRGDVIGRQVLCANCWDVATETQHRKAEDAQHAKGAA